MAVVTLAHVNAQAANGTMLLRDVSFRVDDGELVVLVGPSGAGKTSTIRAIAGLEQVVAGSVLFDEVDVTRADIGARDVGMVFQSQTLFTHQNARRNVGFPLRIRSVDDDEIQKRVKAEARALGIEGLLDEMPGVLSTGHRQLVQIARALVRVPNVLLLDEPMSHLDAPTRSRLRVQLRELQKGYGVTTIYATNDPAEAMFMADRIVALDDGRVRQIGTPIQMYSAPATTHIAWLTGPISFLEATVEPDTEGFWLVGDSFRIRAWTTGLGRHVGGTMQVAVRPEDVRLATSRGVRAIVSGQSFEWGTPVTKIRIGGSSVAVASLDAEAGSPVDVRIERCLVFDSAGQLAGSVGPQLAG